MARSTQFSDTFRDPGSRPLFSLVAGLSLVHQGELALLGGLGAVTLMVRPPLVHCMKHLGEALAIGSVVQMTGKVGGRIVSRQEWTPGPGRWGGRYILHSSCPDLKS